MTAKVVSGETLLRVGRTAALLRDLERRIRLADLEQARRGGNFPVLWNLDVLGALERGLEEFQEEDTMADTKLTAEERAAIPLAPVREDVSQTGYGVADAVGEAGSTQFTRMLSEANQARARLAQHRPVRVVAEVEVLENGYLVSLRGGWGPELRRVAMSPRQAGEAVRALLEAYAKSPEVADTVSP